MTSRTFWGKSVALIGIHLPIPATLATLFGDTPGYDMLHVRLRRPKLPSTIDSEESIEELMMTNPRMLCILALSFVLSACGTTDTTLQQQGHNLSYITGFHDGRHSGMKEAGNHYEQYIKDTERFGSNADYRDGWLAGEAEGKTLQAQAVAAGNAAAGAYGAGQTSKEVDKHDPDKVAKDALKGVDTSALKSLGK